MDPFRVTEFIAEGLWKPMPAGHVAVVMFWHSVGVRWNCPEGHSKTKHSFSKIILLGRHGGVVLLVVVVVPQPSVEQVWTVTWFMDQYFLDGS